MSVLLILLVLLAWYLVPLPLAVLVGRTFGVADRVETGRRRGVALV